MSKFLNYGVIMSLKIFISATSEDLDEMPPFVAFHLGLHCLPKYLFFTGIVNEKGFNTNTCVVGKVIKCLGKAALKNM